MSSKFSNLLQQARSRPNEDEGLNEDKPRKVQEQVTQPTVERKKTSSRPTRGGKVQTSERTELPQVEPAPAPSPSNRGRPRTGKSSDPNYTQITAYISKKTHRDMKVALLNEGAGREISELIEECLISWLKENK